MELTYLNTKEENTWCPGCPNFSILHAFKEAIAELVSEGKIQIKDATIVTGIGCHAKLFDYVNLNGFYGIHGRVLPICLGIKIGNSKLTVIGFGGDGDTYAEGMAHFVHAGRYNADVTMIVHNNQTFSLTTGQATPTSEKGFVGGTTPFGSKENPINPITLALESDAGFVARGFALDIPHLKNLIKQAIEYNGFAFLDVLQPCIIYHNVIPYLRKNVYKLDENHDITDFKKAVDRGREWDYSFDKENKIPIGVFYKKEGKNLKERRPQLQNAWHNIKRTPNWNNIIKEFK